jgi:hypothetical protein
MVAFLTHLWTTHYTWYLVTCNELSLTCQTIQRSPKAPKEPRRAEPKRIRVNPATGALEPAGAPAAAAAPTASANAGAADGVSAIDPA